MVARLVGADHRCPPFPTIDKESSVYFGNALGLVSKQELSWHGTTRKLNSHEGQKGARERRSEENRNSLGSRIFQQLAR